MKEKERYRKMSLISAEEFTRRFLPLVLNSTQLPKKAADLHILLYSAILNLESDQSYTEKEINAHLQGWCLHFGQTMGLDHVTLRRALVDEGFLKREPSGNHYSVNFDALPAQFDPNIRTLDLAALMAQAIEERELRKQEFLRRAKENPPHQKK